MSGPTPDTADAKAPIENKAQLVSYFEKGNKPKSEWRIGTEHEKFPFLKDSLQPVPYHGASSIKSLLEGLQRRFKWDPVFEGDNIIALSDPNGLANISLEPGGQFELSGAPLKSITETDQELQVHFKQVREIGDELGIGFLGLGASPIWSRDDTPVMPKGRYGIMAPYMDKVGTMGRDMMFRTCTVQVNLDFSSESDMVKKLRVSLALQPLATALFANSPFLEGKANGYQSFRSHVWTDTDNHRAGMLPFAFESGMSFERYADFALDVPMYFVMRGGQYVNTAGESFRKFMDGKLPQLPGEKPVMKDWADHLTTIFPEVRLKKYLEMRGADAGDLPHLTALSAFWVGLLYDQPTLDEAWEMVKDWSNEERQYLRNSVPKYGMQTIIRGRPLQSVAKDFLGLSRAGLNARRQDEARYLDTLDEIATSGKTASDHLLELYKTNWHKDVKHVFKAAAF